MKSQPFWGGFKMNFRFPRSKGRQIQLEPRSLPKGLISRRCSLLMKIEGAAFLKSPPVSNPQNLRRFAGRGSIEDFTNETQQDPKPQ